MCLPRFLFPKLVAGKAKNNETKMFHFLLQCIQFHILISVASVCSDINNQDAFACVVAEVHSAATVESPCVVFVDGAICG